MIAKPTALNLPLSLPITRDVRDIMQGAWRRLATVIDRAARFGLVLPIGAASITGVVALALTGALAWPLAVATFLCVYSSYLIDHLADVGELAPEHESDRTKALSNRALFSALGQAAFIGALAISYAYSGLASALLLLCFPVAVALYGTPLFGALAGRFVPYRRLKDIPGIKAFYTAFFWALLVVYAAGFMAAIEPRVTGFFVAYVFLSDLVNTIFCDFKDLERDRLEGVVTLPLMLGVERTTLWLHRVNLAALAVLWGAVMMHWVPSWLIALTPVHLYIGAVVAQGATLVRRGGNPGDGPMDAAFMLWLPLAFIGLNFGC
ncbi:hypothetical protein ACW73L_18830 [Methylolobus aquaticus]